MTTQGFITTFSSLLWAATAGLAVWAGAAAAAALRVESLSEERRRELRLPLILRALLPLAPNARRWALHPRLARMTERSAPRLVSAGIDGVLPPPDYMALRLLFPLVYGPLWIGLVYLCVLPFPAALAARIQVPLSLAGILATLVYPNYWLSTAIANRHRSIRRGLPFVLDILTLSVEAGMDFMTALQRHVERGAASPLTEELGRVIREIQLGRTRKDALRDMSTRINLGDVRTVVNALVQADELGVSIGSILRIQSAQIRQRRFERAERLANEAPVKMLFPLLLFIFPAVFLVLLGPMIVRILQQGF